MNKRNISLYKKMFVIILIIVVVIIAIFSYKLYKIDQNHIKKLNKTSNKIIQETELSDIKEKYYFQENEFYHIFKGESDSQEEMFASVNFPEEAKKIENDNIKTYKSEDLVSEETILNEWEQTCNQCEFIKIQPAIIDNELLWEIKYNDADNRYVFDYYLMSDGTDFESFRLRRNFN